MAEPFHDDDVANATVPAAAFDEGSANTPTRNALLNHLALEVVAHLQERGVPFHFRGGTALHTKLTTRRRFSIDVDIITPDRPAVDKALVEFVQRFPKSEIELRDPPQPLFEDGVRHLLTFPRSAEGNLGAAKIYVEVVDAKLDGLETEALPLTADSFDWRITVTAPTFHAFAGQKLAVLGPNTVGKKVGRRDAYWRKNEGVCKQIFDLKELLTQDLDPTRVRAAYDAAVAESNRLHATSFTSEQSLADAADLLSRLRPPRRKEEADDARYGLWAGHDDSWTYIAQDARKAWQPRNYRISAGMITRLVDSLREPKDDFEKVSEPLRRDAVPADIIAKIGAAEAKNDPWFVEGEFGADAMLAWSWAPRDLW